MPLTSLRLCTNCNSQRPLENFSKNRSRKDGINTICRDCDSKRNRSWRAANAEHRKTYFKSYNADYMGLRKKFRHAIRLLSPTDFLTLFVLCLILNDSKEVAK